MHVFRRMIHLYYADTWRVHPRFVLNYGLGWTYDAPLNYDLHKPAYLAPVLGVAETFADPQELDKLLAVAGLRMEPQG